jgi:protein MpaA
MSGARRGGRRLLVLLACLLGLVAGSLPPAAVAARAQSETVVIGMSAQGRKIVAHHRWREGATKRVLVVGSMHGDERAGSRVVRRMRELPLPANVDLWLIPTVNPDGAAAGRRTNGRRVDLNRNFPHRWRLADKGTRKYSGPAKASEPETQALMALVKEIRPRTTVVFHQPLYGVDSYRPKSMRLVRELSRHTGLPIRSFPCGGVCRGTFTGWLNTTTKGRAVTVEFGKTLPSARLTTMGRAVLTVGSTT